MSDADKVLEVMPDRKKDGRIESPERCYWAPAS